MKCAELRLSRRRGNQARATNHKLCDNTVHILESLKNFSTDLSNRQNQVHIGESEKVR